MFSQYQFYPLILRFNYTVYTYQEKYDISIIESGHTD